MNKWVLCGCFLLKDAVLCIKKCFSIGKGSCSGVLNLGSGREAEPGSLCSSFHGRQFSLKDWRLTGIISPVFLVVYCSPTAIHLFVGKIRDVFVFP